MLATLLEMLEIESRITFRTNLSQRAPASLVLLLLELYHDAPMRCFEMLQLALRKNCLLQWMYLLPHDERNDEDRDRKSPIFRVSKFYRFLASQGRAQLVSHLRQDIDKERQESRLSRFYRESVAVKKNSILLIIAVHWVEFHEHCEGYIDTGDCIRMSPFITGFKQAVDLAVEKRLDNVAENLKEVLTENYSLPETEIGDPLGNLSNNNRKAVLLLYGVSGSGKTRSIKRLLHKHWGHYLLPGNPSL